MRYPEGDPKGGPKGDPKGDPNVILPLFEFAIVDAVPSFVASVKMPTSKGAVQSGVSSELGSIF